MDGNGRWAESLGQSRQYGHQVGSSRVYEIFKVCTELGCKTATFFAMSSENMNRNETEISFISQLLKSSINEHFSDLVNNKIKFKVIGDLSSLPNKILEIIQHAENETKKFSRYNLNIAYNYGGHWDIINAANLAVLNHKQINYETLCKYLSTSVNYPDLIVRTGGYKRLSNFMLWQAAYSEFQFLDILWPDISKNDIECIFDNYENTQRKFGLVK
ncbi:MAG: di-trans,poly-cis-decaprenylcistransferase [Gammaproteobacteria bacterium]|jgi:undecaprenyl diphosphate synthase|nr:di-trans,poly-cis-decaprenylcistransferase [Gammaproteobacteria bacterium]MBL6899242.1 di-trans,poly-cis-decaprenylcistransferase [Gammaproteobacteria bacterium]